MEDRFWEWIAPRLVLSAAYAVVENVQDGVVLNMRKSLDDILETGNYPKHAEFCHTPDGDLIAKATLQGKGRMRSS